MGFLDWLRGGGSKDSKEENPSVGEARNALNLQVNDIVTYDLEDYIVVGKLEYNDSGYKWLAYNLKGTDGYIWLAAELDDELELGIYQRVPTKISETVPDRLEVEGITYYMEEHGRARIAAAEGQVGASEGQQVEYWDFESENEQYLSVESWGGDLEVSSGYPIKERDLKFLAGS